MNSSIDHIEDQDEKQRLKNKKRLVNQNKKLNTEIRKLQTEINQILPNKDSEENGLGGKNKEQAYNKLRQQLTMQEKYLRKLKTKIDFLKSTNVKANAQYIIREEDELRIIKKQYKSLQLEKQTVIKFKLDKLKQLQKNQPFSQHKSQIENNLAEVKNQNRKMQADITQLEREIRKYHNLQTMHKIVSREKNGNTGDVQFELAEAKHELTEIRKKTKQIEEKWKPQFETLDKIYFELKETFLQKQGKLQEIEKEHRMWETRKNSLRGEDQILQYRQRLSKINTTQWKMPEMSTVVKRKPKQQLENYLVHTNRQHQQNKLNKQQDDNDKNGINSIEEEPQIIDNNKFSQVNTLQQNKGKSKQQKNNEEEQKANTEKGKKKKANKPEDIVMLSKKKDDKKDKKNQVKQNLKEVVKPLKKQSVKQSLLTKKNEKIQQSSPEKPSNKLPKSPQKQTKINKLAPLTKQKKQSISNSQVQSQKGKEKSSRKQIQKQKSQKQINKQVISKQSEAKQIGKTKNKNDVPANKKGVKMILKNVGVGTG